MARVKKTETVEKAISKLDTPSRFQIGEMGYSGHEIFNGVSTEEIKRELNFPQSIRTYKEMSYHSCINSALSLYENLISKVTWRVVAPKDATEEEKNQCKFVEECLEDMDHPFRQVIKDALSSNIYGFSVQEKVYRKRLKSNGSMFNDGKIGLKKIALRNQETIEKFLFDESGNEVIGVKQSLKGVTAPYGTSVQNATINMPRSKFMLITTGRNRNDPYGKSPLRDVYLAWRYLIVIQEIEAAGVARDLQGMPVLSIPAQYMSDDASPEQKAAYENFKNIIRNIQNNSQSGVILPSQADPETRLPLFDLKLLSTEGGKKNFDTTKVKEYYQNQIYTGLFADVLILGQGGVGSFALGQIKNSLTGSAVESMLDNIVDCFNRDVIRQIYELNGWEVSRAGKLDYEGLNPVDLETLSKYWQRVTSVNLVEKDRPVLNAVRTAAGLDPLPEDMEPRKDMMDSGKSGASEGMAKGSGNGTSDNAAGTDTSANNSDNSA